MQGKIIEYVEQGRFFCALVLQDQGKRLRIMNQNGKEINLPASRVLHQAEDKHPTQLAREEIMQQLQGVAEKRLKMVAAIDLAEIWQAQRQFSATWPDLEDLWHEMGWSLCQNLSTSIEAVEI